MNCDEVIKVKNHAPTIDGAASTFDRGSYESGQINIAFVSELKM